ncbi:transglutaminase family protein [Ideonella sp.]|jgi:hypothetical protein|uniref:transglutaminase family protein n=1 Tax=Ideonella sp. TaxID=1929293 RepID=UPI0037C174E8
MTAAARGRLWRTALATLVLAMLVMPVPLSAQSLAAVPVEALAEPNGASTSPKPRVRVFAQDAPGLARMWGQADGQSGSNGYVELELMLGTHPSLDEPSAAALSASFIVDFNDAAVQRLRHQLLTDLGSRVPTGDDVVRFVARSMRGDYASSSPYASKVARSLQGDCTEYSLLTAALARSVQIPARIVNGLALVYVEERWQAYGHAWVQTFEAGQWVVRDSALADLPGPAFYVPAFSFSDEGPGYQLDQMRHIGRMPSRVQIIDLGRAGGMPNRD